MHSRKIAHRVRYTLYHCFFSCLQENFLQDIHGGNFLVNHFTFDLDRSVKDFQAHLNGEYGIPVRYSLFDFNISVAFPEDLAMEECRLDEECLKQGTRFHEASQVMQGELDYDPFAFDVECMGYIFIRYLAVSISVSFLSSRLNAPLSASSS